MPFNLLSHFTLELLFWKKENIAYWCYQFILWDQFRFNTEWHCSLRNHQVMIAFHSSNKQVNDYIKTSHGSECTRECFDSSLPFLIAWIGPAGRKPQTFPLHIEFSGSFTLVLQHFFTLLLYPKVKRDEVVPFLMAAAHKEGTGFPFHKIFISHFCWFHLI